MPNRPGSPCRYPLCPNLATYRGYCKKHQKESESRPNASRRGYDANWRQSREKCLRQHGIPASEWYKYDIDHEPRYDASIDPDHSHYRLTPRLHSEHSRKTATEDHSPRIW